MDATRNTVVGVDTAVIDGVPVRVGSRRELAPPDQSRAHAAAQRLAYRAAHRIVANSEAAAARLREERVPASQITVIPNGVELGAFQADAQRSSRNAVIATVANLRDGKGHDVLLRAACLVLRRVPSARFRLIGDGPLRQPLIDLADALTGRELTRIALGDAFLARYRHRYFVIHRRDLHGAILEGCRARPEITLEASRGIVRFEDRGDAVTAFCEDGTQYDGAALIGA